MDIGVSLRWYKQPRVQAAILDMAKGREIGVRYFDRGFGKRPDVLVYPRDVLEFAKKGASSFHCSEELWHNPLHLSTELSLEQLACLRTGWDFVLDIDCPLWEFSKRITQLSVDVISNFGIRSIGVKFSGNKGFHVGVPFEAFPKSFQNTQSNLLFPEAPRKMAGYISHLIEQKLLETLTLADKQQIADFLGKQPEEVFRARCKVCKHPFKQGGGMEFICPLCGKQEAPASHPAYMICPKCKVIMNREEHKAGCLHCGTLEPPEVEFDISSILKIDTMLISSRHMFRMLGSLHEKSGLASIPVEPKDILGFDKAKASPERASLATGWLKRGVAKPEEGASLLIEAYDFFARAGKEEAESRPRLNYELPVTPIESEQFPPCVRLILKGLSEGRKRGMFILINFLRSMGWDYLRIEHTLLQWNERNKPPLKRAIVSGRLAHFKQEKQAKLPPNCNREEYYLDMGVCKPNGVCRRIKNPANYHRLSEASGKGKSAKRKAK
jgi:hypothetical protein